MRYKYVKNGKVYYGKDGDNWTLWYDDGFTVYDLKKRLELDPIYGDTLLESRGDGLDQPNIQGVDK